MDRLKWDARFLQLASEIAIWSKDPSSKVGAVIADGKRIVTLGYNGFPSDIEDKPEWLQDRQIRLGLTRHAEDNAIDFAMPQELFGTAIYTTPFPPCIRCAKRIVKSGIERVVSINNFPERWKSEMAEALRYLKDNNVEISLYDALMTPPSDDKFVYFPSPERIIDGL